MRLVSLPTEDERRIAMHLDLLEGILPAGNPLVPFDPQELSSTFVTAPRVEIQLVGEPPQVIPKAEIAQLVLPKKPVRKRRRSWVGPIMTLLVLAMFGGLAACVWLLVSGKGLTTSGQLVAATPTSDIDKGNSPAIPTRPVDTPPPPRGSAENDPGKSDRIEFDPVMGGGNGPRNGETRNGGMDVEQPTTPPTPAEPPLVENPAEEIPMEAAPADVAPVEVAPANVAPMEEETPAEVPEVEPVVEMNAASEADDGAFEEALEAVADRYRSGEVAAAAPLVELAEELATTPVQRQRLNGFALLPELLEHYREGIGRGAESLGAGETIDLVPGLTINVVESSRQKFAFKVEGRVKSYALEKAPLVVLHRLASMGLPPGDKVAEGGKAVFQAFWPSATLAHRQQSLEWLRSIPTTDEFDPAMLAAALRHIFELPETITTE